MKLTRRQFGSGLLVAAALPASALASGAVQRDARRLLGTRVDLTVVHADAATRAHAVQAAWAQMARLEALMSRYQPASFVSALARAAGREPIAVPPEVWPVLQAAQARAAQTAGAFDITVGAYGDYGFGGAKAALPSPAQLRRRQSLVGFKALQLDAKARTAFLPQAGMAIDLGGIAKLPILAAGLAAIKAQGIASAMVNGGGDVLTAGQIQGRDWRVGLRDPRAPAQLIGTVAVSDAVIASSGDYERFFDVAGHRHHHILDPRTGQSAQGPHGVALIARDVAAVNGWGAAVMVAGHAQGQRWLAAERGVDTLIASDAALWLSPGMGLRLVG